MNVLYENKDLIIVFKEKGVPVQGDNSGVKSLLDSVNEYINTQCYVITRLDRPVSGLALFAKNKKSAATLSQMVQEHKIHKTYYAVVCGKLDGSGRLENYIFKNQRQNMSKIVNSGNVGAKLAILEYDAIDHFEDYTLVKINLITGRHHQIRVQFAHMGYPLYGDTKYNPQFKFKRNVATALFAGGLNFEFKNKNININIKPKGEIYDNFKNT